MWRAAGASNGSQESPGEGSEHSRGQLSLVWAPAEPEKSPRAFWRATLPCQSPAGGDGNDTPARAGSVHVLTTGSREQASATAQGIVMHQERFCRAPGTRSCPSIHTLELSWMNRLGLARVFQCSHVPSPARTSPAGLSAGVL